ncbi:MAG: YjbQ family protein [Sneathiella sp.]|nr:YjbQ family protein [Sneathiella sp.]
MWQKSGDLTVQTLGKGLTDITRKVDQFLLDIGARQGVLTLFIQHSSASLTIQENADPDVQRDLEDYMEKIVPEGHGLYRHDSEGLDDMPAHIRSALTDVSLTIPVLQGEMRLGTWQGIYVFEHRERPHNRHLALHFIGE